MVDRMSNGVHLSHLLKGLGEIPSDNDPLISGVQIDSRKVMSGDCFMAIQGTHSHGINYLQKALEAGANVVLVSTQDVDLVPQEYIRSVMFVNELAEKVGEIAHRFYGEVTSVMKTLGVTGTNGKTSVSCYIAQAIDQLVSPGTCGVIGTLGQGLLADLKDTGMTTPDVISLHRAMAACHEDGAQSIVIEASSHGLDQSRLNGVQFDVAIFTNLTRDHLDYHADMQSYAEAKSRLFNWPTLGHAVINLDDPYAPKLLSRIETNVKVIGYSVNPDLQNSQNMAPLVDQLLVAEHISSSIEGLVLRIRLGEQKAICRVPVIGEFNASNVLAAVGALIACGFNFADSVTALSKIRGVAGRMELISHPEQPAVVVDFAHTPDGLDKALSSLKPLCQGELWCVMGCGGDRDRGKRALMASVADAIADRVVLTSDNPRSENPQAILVDMQAGVKNVDKAIRLVDRKEAIVYAITHAKPGDVILIAGKGHETWQEIQGEKFPFSDRMVALASLQQGGGA